MVNIGDLFGQANSLMNQNSVLPISPTGSGFAQPGPQTPSSATPSSTNGGQVAIPNFGPWLAGFVVMAGVLIFAAESDNWGGLATAFAVVIAGAVAFHWGPTAVSNLKGLL